MALAPPRTVSIADRAKTADAGAPPISAAFLGGEAAFVLAEQDLLLVASDGETRRVELHAGGILAATAGTAGLLTGGDDGRLVLADASGAREIAADMKRRWIDQVAHGPDGAVAWSAGRTVSVRTAKGEIRVREAPSTPGGLAFAPKGFRLAIAHYGGVSLWFPNQPAAKPEFLAWKGSHLGVAWSPDGRFVVTTMQEPTLHGWRVADKANMRMSGYPGRVRSMAFTDGGRFLATSGSSEVILWPFTGKDGPMGRQPVMLAPTSHRVTVVATHPSAEVLACGYEDGLVLMVRIEDGAEILVRKADGVPVTALAWNADGRALAFGAENGSVGVVRL